MLSSSSVEEQLEGAEVDLRAALFFLFFFWGDARGLLDELDGFPVYLSDLSQLRSHPESGAPVCAFAQNGTKEKQVIPRPAALSTATDALRLTSLNRCLGCELQRALVDTHTWRMSVNYRLAKS